MAFTLFNLVPSAQQQSDFLHAADQRCETSGLTRLEAPLGPTLARDPPCGQRLGEAFKLLRPELIEFE